jgi:hypothetical protein
MENNLSLELTKSQILLSVASINLQKMLQEGEQIVFSKETLQQDYAPLKQLKEAKSAIEKLENPYTAQWKQWNEARASVLNPVKELIDRKSNEYTKLAEEIKKEKFQQHQEQERIKTIRNNIQLKKMHFAGKIVGAGTPEELIDVEKLMGLEKTRKSEYQEFITELSSQLEELKPLITGKKQTFKEIASLEAKVFENDEEIIMAEEQKERLLKTIQEANQNIQHTTLDSALAVDIPQVGETVASIPKARRTTATWEIVDINVLAKKAPDYVELKEKAEKIDEKMKELRTSKEWKKGTELIWNGIRFFEKITY